MTDELPETPPPETDVHADPFAAQTPTPGAEAADRALAEASRALAAEPAKAATTARIRVYRVVEWYDAARDVDVEALILATTDTFAKTRDARRWLDKNAEGGQRYRIMQDKEGWRAKVMLEDDDS